LSIDLAKDVRRLRVLLLLAALVFAGLTGWIALRESRPEWEELQGKFRRQTKTSANQKQGIMQLPTCAGTVDRCTTCHLGIQRKDLGGPEIEQPFKGHPQGTAHHLKNRVGCSLCHGGTGRALTSKVAHSMPGTSQKDPMLTQPFIQASCIGCHVPGDQPGMPKLTEGAKLYLLLGCSICHPLTGGGRGGWDYGPDLRSLGRKSLAYLEASLIEPTANFPQSTMPTFKHTFKGQPDHLENMLIYLLSLGLPDAGNCPNRNRQNEAMLSEACANCHSGQSGQACGRFEHRCLYLIERKSELSCAGCHQESIPEPGLGQGLCPPINQHRANCVVCHLEIEKEAGL